MCQVPNFNYSNPLLKHSCSPFPKATTLILFYQREKPADLPHEEKNAQIKKLACFFSMGSHLLYNQIFSSALTWKEM